MFSMLLSQLCSFCKNSKNFRVMDILHGFLRRKPPGDIASMLQARFFLDFFVGRFF